MLANYGLFMAKITCVFGIYNEMATVKQKLEKLHQQGSTHVYTAEFQQIASFLAWGDLALSYQYYKGLKDNVKDCTFNQRQLESLNELINMAARINDKQHKQQLECNS